MEMGRIAGLVALVAMAAAWVLFFFQDYRRCQGIKEKQFILLSFVLLTSLLLFILATRHGIVVGMVLFLAVRVFLAIRRWAMRKRRDIRFLEDISSRKNKLTNIRLG